MATANDITNLNAAVKANPTDITARLALADAYEEQGKTRMAKRTRLAASKKELAQKAKMEEMEGYRDELRKLCPVGCVVYSIVRHVSSSGMRRHISFYAIQNNEPRFLDGLISKVTDLKRVPMGKGEGLIVDGCGMDMCYHVVETVCRVLYADGVSLHCRSL